MSEFLNDESQTGIFTHVNDTLDEWKNEKILLSQKQIDVRCVVKSVCFFRYRQYNTIFVEFDTLVILRMFTNVLQFI